MRLLIPSIIVLIPFIMSLLGYVHAFSEGWDQTDYEIFDLSDSLQSIFGETSTFYSFLELPPEATTQQISKAYRKMSLLYHPDRSQLPNADKIFQLLGTIQNILRDNNARAKYDYHLRNGIPKWRGTGYYYSRYRPTLFHTIIFLLILTSIGHYICLWALYFKQKHDLSLWRVEFERRLARQEKKLRKKQKDKNVSNIKRSGSSDSLTTTSSLNNDELERLEYLEEVTRKPGLEDVMVVAMVKWLVMRVTVRSCKGEEELHADHANGTEAGHSESPNVASVGSLKSRKKRQQKETAEREADSDNSMMNRVEGSTKQSPLRREI